MILLIGRKTLCRTKRNGVGKVKTHEDAEVLKTPKWIISSQVPKDFFLQQKESTGMQFREQMLVGHHRDLSRSSDGIRCAPASGENQRIA
jgi:hypothetical protein